jgi:hypothetical protein
MALGSHRDSISGRIFHPRVERSRVELKRLQDEHRSWQRHRRAAVRAKQYETQLNAIGELVRQGVEKLAEGLNAVDLSLPDNSIYETCRTFDLRLLWLRRVWHFFREKFDQRDGEFADTLRAADDVVWSCYQQVLENARSLGVPRKGGASPLPFIEARYSPSTFPADLVPSGLQSEIDKPFLREHLNRLPVPVVRLQPDCVSGPWWLVYAAHEVGHNVQYDLLKRQALVEGYRKLVAETIGGLSQDPKDAERWGNWSREIFADIFSVLMMGTWAVWAMVELELQGDIAMGERREQYPSGAVRLALLATTATAVGLDVRPALRGLDPAQIAAGSVGGRQDLAFVNAVVAASLRPIYPLKFTLVQVCGFKATEFQGGEQGNPPRVEALRTVLADGQEPALSRSLEGPRLAAAAALAAWAEKMASDDEQFRTGLRERTLKLIATSAPLDVRGADRDDAAVVGDTSTAVDSLLDSLLAAGRDELKA